MKTFFNLKNIFVFTFCFLFFLSFSFVFAVDCSTTNQVGLSNIGIDLLSDPTGRSCPDLYNNNSTIADNIGSKVSTIVKVIFGFFSTIGLIAFVYAGVTILISNGDSKVYGKGWNIIRYTFTGMIIMIFSYAIANFLLSTIPSFTGQPGSSGTASSLNIVSCNRHSDCSSVPDSYCCMEGFDGCNFNTCTLLNPGDLCGSHDGKCYKTTDTVNISNKTITGDGFCANIPGWNCYK